MDRLEKDDIDHPLEQTQIEVTIRYMEKRYFNSQDTIPNKQQKTKLYRRHSTEYNVHKINDILNNKHHRRKNNRTSKKSIFCRMSLINFVPIAFLFKTTNANTISQQPMSYKSITIVTDGLVIGDFVTLTAITINPT
jgi:hypothetical protein